MYFYTNAFKLHDTHGVPLTVQLDVAEDKGMRISIPHFYRDAIKAGWKQAKVVSVIREALGEHGCSEEYIHNAIEYLVFGKDPPTDDVCF